ASDYDNSSPVPQIQNVSPSADTTAPSQQELDLLFGPLYDEFFTAGKQDIQPTTIIHPTTEPINPTTTVTAEENNTDNQAKIQVDNAHVDDNEFYNVFSTPVHEEAESSSRYVDPQSKQDDNFATDPEMCMFTLTLSTAEPKNIKEAIADSAWIEEIHDELHQFDRLQLWKLDDKPF
ncbi:hypothetical protein Tco_1361066, partial [Tanacetum coccineum]